MLVSDSLSSPPKDCFWIGLEKMFIREHLFLFPKPGWRKERIANKLGWIKERIANKPGWKKVHVEGIL